MTEPRIIQKVPLDTHRALYLISFNPETEELIFRTSMNPKNLQQEFVKVQGDMIYTVDYHFHISFLTRLLAPNES